MLIGWMRIVFLYSLILVCIKYLAQFRIIVLARKGVLIGKRSDRRPPQRDRKRSAVGPPGDLHLCSLLFMPVQSA